jgi:hypothetical protein
VRIQVGNVDVTFVGTSVVGALLGVFVGAFVVRVQVGNVDGECVVRVQVGNADDVFVGTSVVRALLGAFVGDLVGARDGGEIWTNFEITGGFSSSGHCLAVKASETKIPDDPKARRAKKVTEQERIMIVTSSSNRFILSLETRQLEGTTVYLGYL